MWLVNPILGAVHDVLRVRVTLESVGVNDFLGELATDNKCILWWIMSDHSAGREDVSIAYPHNVPLALGSEHGQELA